MNIALLNDSFPPTVDGVANVVLNYAKVLQSQETSCFVATPWYPDVQDDYTFPVIRYRSYNAKGTGYRAGEPFSPKLMRQFETIAPDLLHSHCPIVSTILARMVRERLHVPLVFTYHTKFDIDIRKAVKGKLLQEASLRAILNNIAACDEVWTVSRGAGENLKSLGYQGDYRVMENGVDFPKGTASQAAIQSLEEEYRLLPHVPLFLYVGRMMWYKGIRLSIDGLKAACERGLVFRFMIVGDGVDCKEIHSYVQEQGLEQYCIFTGMIRDREKLRAIFSRANLFLFPSTFDTNGIVVREAAACNCPSLLLQGSCAAEGITNYRNGLLIQPTIDDMANMLFWAATHLPVLREIGQNAGNEIYLSWQDAVSRAALRYDEIVKEHRDKPLRKLPELNESVFSLAAAALSRLGKLNEKHTARHDLFRFKN